VSRKASEGVVSLPFRTERLVMLVPVGHPLAGRGGRDHCDFCSEHGALMSK